MATAPFLTAATGIIGVFIGILPLYRGITLESHGNRFIWLLCLSFGVTGISLLLGAALNTATHTLVALHAIFWTMLYTSFIAALFKKPVFFWALLAVPLSLFTFFLFWDGFILDFGAIMGSIMLIETLVFTTINGGQHIRLTSVTALLAAVFSTAYFYPVPALGAWNMLLLFGSFTGAGLSLLVLTATSLPQLELSTTPQLSYLVYGVFALFLAVFAAAFQSTASILLTVAGVLTLISVTGLIVAPQHRRRVTTFLAVATITAAITWLMTAVSTATLQSGVVVLRFEASLFQLATIAAAQLLAFYVVETRAV